MLCWGSSPWGVRRLLAHINHLPRDSAFSRALRGDQAYWDEQVELTAQLIDAVNINSYYLLRVNGSTTAAVPQPTKRPASAQTDVPVSSLSEFAAFIQRGG
jgi:hypothetical protein